MKILLWEGIVPPPPGDGQCQVAAAATWQAALEQVAECAQLSGSRVHHLTLLCPGGPAQLGLGQGIATRDDCVSFAAGLRTCMVEGGLIELLVPRLAALTIQGGGESREASEIPVASARRYFDALPGGTQAARGSSDKAGSPGIDDASSALSATGLSAGESERILRARWPFAGNGLRFCFTLATVSGCIVRACNGGLALTPEKAQKPGLQDLPGERDSFVEWEGQVWDFGPDGDIQYLGQDLMRAGLPYPRQWCGPALVV